MFKATYYFRGILVYEFDGTNIEIGENAHMCSFIPDDMAEMSNFLNECWHYQKGNRDTVRSIEVD